jgi:hypothetical protein
MTSLFNRWIPSLTLAVWSAILLATFFTGRVTALLHPSFRPGVLVAGGILALLSLFIASRSTPPECCADARCTHPLSRSKAGRWVTFLILVLPVSVAAWLSPQNFSRQLMENRGISTDIAGLGLRSRPNATPEASIKSQTAGPSSVPPVATTPPASPSTTPDAPPASSASTTAPAAPTASVTPSAPSASTAQPATANATPVPAAPPAQSGPNPQNLPDYMQRTPEGHVAAEILDLLYSVQDSQLRKDFEGKTVQLIAQTMPDKTSEGGASPRFKAVRMFMTCCAADARPVATLIQTKTPLDLPEMSWVKIVGKATFPVEKGKRIALVEADSVQPTKPPEETMLFQ